MLALIIQVISWSRCPSLDLRVWCLLTARSRQRTAVESVWFSVVLALEKVAFRNPIQNILFTCYPFLTLFLNTADSASSLGELSSQDSHFSQDPVQMGRANSGGSCPCDSRSSSEYFEPDPYYGAYTTDLYEGEPTREEA